MEKIIIPKNDGTKLSAWQDLPPKPYYLLIVCHGFFGAKENRGRIFSLAAELYTRGLGILAFDFAGSGESDGDFSSVTLSSQADDLKTVIDYADENYQLPLILLGRSFGGSTILALGQHPASVKGCILWSAPLDLPNTFRMVLGDLYDELEAGRSIKVVDGEREYDLLPQLVMDIEHHDLKRNLSILSGKPVLICQGKADEVVDFSNALAMHESLPRSALALIDNADHRFTDMVELREKITIEWLEDNFLK